MRMMRPNMVNAVGYCSVLRDDGAYWVHFVQPFGSRNVTDWTFYPSYLELAGDGFVPTAELEAIKAKKQTKPPPKDELR